MICDFREIPNSETNQRTNQQTRYHVIAITPAMGVNALQTLGVLRYLHFFPLRLPSILPPFNPARGDGAAL